MGGLESSKPELYYKFGDYKYNKIGKDRVLSKYRQLDYLLSGFEMGCITIWTGITNSGKTIMLTTIARESIMQNEKVFFFNGEQTKDDFKNNLYKQSVVREDIEAIQYKDTNIYDYYVKDDMLSLMREMFDNQIFVFNNDIKKNINILLNAMTQAHKEENVRVFIIDNFMQIDLDNENIFQEQSNIMEKLRAFAVANNVHIHLVAHPKKIENWQVRLSLYDISGSMNLANKAYNIVSLIRKSMIQIDSLEYTKLKTDLFNENYDIDSCDQVLEVLKTKGNRLGLVGLKYVPVNKNYLEISKLTDYEKEVLQNRLEYEKEQSKPQKRKNIFENIY